MCFYFWHWCKRARVSFLFAELFAGHFASSLQSQNHPTCWLQFVSASNLHTLRRPMVISSTLTTQLGNVRAPVPLSRTRPRSVPVYTSRSPTSLPNQSRLERKRRVPRKKFVEDKPTFVNFASANINPYVSLTPTPLHQHARRPRSRMRSSKLQHRKQAASADLIRTSPDDELAPSEVPAPVATKRVFVNHGPIDIQPADRSAFRREFRHRCQLVVGNVFYRTTVDGWKATSLNHLITLFEDLTGDEHTIDRLWTIYYWISQNIRYDIDADINHHSRQQKAEDVFRAGKSSCQGYAAIFQTLCDSMKIPCETIEGYAKDYSFKIDQVTFSHTNHTWNAVQIDQHWYLLDSAWGTGYVDGNHEYKKDLKPYYFLTCPEQMIYNHLPEDSHWQFLSKTISMDDYIRLPHVHSYYFTFGLTIVSPPFSSVLAFDTNQSVAEVLIQAPEDVQLTCVVKNDLRSTSLAQYDVNRKLWQCLFAPHKSGFHTLIIFAARLSTEKLFKNAIELGVDVTSKDLDRKKTLPITFEKFLEHKCQIISPMTGVLKHGTKTIIRCRIPQAFSARISVDGVWLDEVSMRSDLFKQEINVPERQVTVYARFHHRTSAKIYDGLIEYHVAKWVYEQQRSSSSLFQFRLAARVERERERKIRAQSLLKMFAQTLNKTSAHCAQTKTVDSSDILLVKIGNKTTPAQCWKWHLWIFFWIVHRIEAMV